MLPYRVLGDIFSQHRRLTNRAFCMVVCMVCESHILYGHSCRYPELSLHFKMWHGKLLIKLLPFFYTLDFYWWISRPHFDFLSLQWEYNFLRNRVIYSSEGKLKKRKFTLNTFCFKYVLRVNKLEINLFGLVSSIQPQK